MLPDNGHAGGVIFVLINAHDKHRSIRGWSRHNHTLSTSFDVSLWLRGRSNCCVYVSAHVCTCFCDYLRRPSPRWGRLQWIQLHTEHQRCPRGSQMASCWRWWKKKRISTGLRWQNSLLPWQQTVNIIVTYHLKTDMVWPSTINLPFSSLTSPLKRLWVESYLNM